MKKSKWTKDDTELSILALPTTIWYILFCYLPMFGIILAFKDYKITPGASFLTSLLKSDWVGFDNFKYFFSARMDSSVSSLVHLLFFSAGGLAWVFEVDRRSRDSIRAFGIRCWQ